MLALLGLGGNLGDVRAAFAAAREQLGERFRLVAASSLWRTAPQGPAQPDFLNAALLLEADVHPLRLLAACLDVEARSGRQRADERRWGPRPLDVDLLLAEGVVAEGPALTLPHPRLALRRFALLPAVELAPEWVHPRVRRSLAELLAQLFPDEQPCQRLGPFPG